MSKFEESNFYKALQDFFINNNKNTFLEMLSEFYNRTEGIIDKNKIQDELIKELRELYLEFNEKGIDENIVREKVNYFLENSVRINNIISKLNTNTNNIKNISSKLDTNTNNIKNISSQLDTKTKQLDDKINEVAKTGTTIETVQNKVEDMAEKGLIQAYTIGDGTIEHNKLSSDLVNSIYDTSFISDTKVDLIEVDTILNKKAYFNSTYKLMGFTDSTPNSCCKIFNLKANKKYEIKGAGMNGENTPLAVSCEQLITDTSATCKYKDTFIGTSDVSIIYEIFNYTPTVDCYIYVNGTNSYVKELKTSFEPYGIINGKKITEIKNNINEIENKIKEVKCDIIVENNLQTITHFTKDKNIYICRVFKHCFINNLLQLQSMYTANLNSNNQLIKIEEIGTSWSDVIGPISIHRGDEDSWVGSWAGGSHGISINEVEYATAKEISMQLYVDKTLITKDGFYEGNAKIVTVNDLYFPKTVSGEDLSTATKAIKETREYNLTNKMEIDVKLEFYNDVYINMYYGCQCNTYNMQKVIFPNNEIISNIKNLPSNVNWIEKENRYFCFNDNAHYNVELKQYGLANYKYNTSNQFGYLATFDKIYFILIQNESTPRLFNTDKVLTWGAIYDYYLD